MTKKGKYGPFKPNIATKVPLWFALSLKKTKKARIKIPKWLSEKSLRRIFKNENENVSFSSIPFYAFDIAKLLFLNAADDFKLCQMNVGRIRILLVDIENKRTAKIKNGLKEIEASTIYLSLPNVTAFELSKIRYFVSMRLKLGSQITQIQNKQNALSQDGDFTQEQSERNEDEEKAEIDYEQQNGDGNFIGDDDNQSMNENENRPLRKLRRFQK